MNFETCESLRGLSFASCPCPDVLLSWDPLIGFSIAFAACLLDLLELALGPTADGKAPALAFIRSRLFVAFARVCFLKPNICDIVFSAVVLGVVTSLLAVFAFFAAFLAFLIAVLDFLGLADGSGALSSPCEAFDWDSPFFAVS